MWDGIRRESLEGGLMIVLLIMLGGYISFWTVFRWLMLRRILPYPSLLPELNYFTSYKARARAHDSAISSFHGHVWIAVVWSLCVLSNLLLMPWVQYFCGNRLASVVVNLFCAGILPVVISYVVLYWLFREKLRRALREQLSGAPSLGVCTQCGYDLRASKDRCPECGTEFETSCSARP